VKIKLDENLPDDLASLLRAADYDVSTLPKEKLAGYDDPPVLEAASAEDRGLMSFDLGFADIRRYQPGAHAGIVVFRLKDQRWKTLEKPVRRLVSTGALKELRQGLAIVDEGRICFRRGTKPPR
jgi:predicted nuclease of predicted toxin-antitoxin system